MLTIISYESYEKLWQILLINNGRFKEVISGFASLFISFVGFVLINCEIS